MGDKSREESTDGEMRDSLSSLDEECAQLAEEQKEAVLGRINRKLGNVRHLKLNSQLRNSEKGAIFSRAVSF